ncbi:MAG: NusG domain II-containing protein [Halanaerobacter sp.]
MLEKIADLNNLLTTADKAVIIFILLFSILLIIVTPHLAARGEGEKDIVVTLADREIYRRRLRDSSQLKRVKFDFDYQGTTYQGVLRIKNNRVKMERLNEDISPLAIHAEMGWISEPHQMIVCLPIQLIVTIESNNSKQEEIDLRTF